MMGDLDKLIAAVEAGEWITGLHLPYELHTDLTWKAFNGSLDAALRLHEALLPGWHLTDMWINGDGLMGGAGVWREGVNDSEAFSAHASSPARAWLLAILRAVKAKQPDTDPNLTQPQLVSGGNT